MDNLQLNQLQAFISVAEYLNFTEAANRMFVTQSSVSQQIAQLEKEIGVPLFIRNKRSVQLTPAGNVFLKEAKEILQKADIAIEKAQRASKGYIGKLRIGFLAYPVRDFLPKFIRKFSERYPEIEIDLNHYDVSKLNDKLMNHELDVIISVSLAVEHLTGIDYEEIFSVPNCVVLHNEHPLANRQSIHMGDLVHENFIVRDHQESPHWFDHTMMICSKYGFIPKKIIQTKRIESALMYIDAGHGVGIFPKYLNMYASPNLVFLPIENEEAIQVVIAQHKMNVNPSLNLFHGKLKKVINEQILVH